MVYFYSLGRRREVRTRDKRGTSLRVYGIVGVTYVVKYAGSIIPTSCYLFSQSLQNSDSQLLVFKIIIGVCFSSLSH